MGWLGWVILFIAIGTVVTVYGYVPLWIRKGQWISVAPEFNPIEPSDGRIPASTHAFFLEVVRELKPLGFDPMLWVLSLEPQKNVTGFLVIFENRGDSAAAAAMSVVASMPNGATQSTHIAEFETTFTDGSALNTNNSSSGSVFPALPWVRTYKFADMADLGLLYHMHRHLSATVGTAPKEAPPACGNILRSLRESLDREYAEHVRTGHLELAENRREYHQTIKGAYRAVWCLLWPLKHIMRWRHDKAARRLLRELGLPSEYETVDYVAKYKAVEEEIETAELVEE